MVLLTFRLVTWPLLLLTVAAQLEIPPTITVGPQAETAHIHEDVSPKNMLCYASGFPKPRITWYRNGQELDGKTLPEFELNKDTAEGYYHCRANNKLGTALSNVTRVVKALQASFSQATHTMQYKAMVGDRVTINCNYQSSGVPTPRVEDYSWMVVNGERISTNQRVQIDEFGNLRIASVKDDDFNTERECRIMNRERNVNVGGSTSKIEKANGTRVEKTIPRIFFYSNMTGNPDSSSSSVVVGLEGRDVYLRCFFSGSDDITYQWKRDDDVNIQYDRFIRNTIKSELHITEIKKSDAATYVCLGTNSLGTTTFKIRLDVYAAPVFTSIDNQPHNVNKSVGDTVEFNCKPYANPPAMVQWYKNGDALDPEKASSNLANFHWSDDRQTLTISNLCKNNCPGGKEADIMVIQCNASNQFDYAFINGYINVFDRTKFTTSLPSEVIVEEGSSLTLSAHAVSDRTTPVTYRWTRDDRQLYDNINRVRITVTDDGGTNLTISEFSSEDVGTYRCIATNDISTDVLETPVTIPGKKADLWPLILAIIVLMIIFFILSIVLFVACFIYQNRGEDYPVDETERKQGNDPEQDLEDSGFQPFQRKEVSGDGTSTISRSSLERLDRRSIDEETGLIRDRAGSLGGTFK